MASSPMSALLLLSSGPRSCSPGSSRRLFKMQQQLLIMETLEMWAQIHLSVHTTLVLTQPG
ncbi:unnamed protein product [Tetraodon nigroviridis]|uniref:(spotted green pufferfish) hypothetical protein n=1 Tax=Tetraodon nigroviridis TaxID=99883 RepID=Q4T3C6_TETNG|nr:unnamed protein product [Tetraodon nigroviridis]